MNKKQKLFMIGNTHFDPVWLWKWDEAMASIRATFRSALDRMTEDDDFIYSFSTPPVFDWIKNTDPQMFMEIKRRIEEGRWELAEGWWVQPDCYGAGGESYVRQGLYAQKYLKDNFGTMSKCVFNIDSFGHSPALPQILKKSHIDYYCFVRPEKRHITLNSPLFNWEGIDGSKVLTFRAEEAYSKSLSECIEAQEEKNDDILIVYGVTDHGGAPTKKMISEIHSMENASFSSVLGFFEEHTDCTYTVKDELLTGDFGPYSNYPYIKKLNRIAEYAVLNAEKASLIAQNYDKVKIEECWRDILFNQFHDILGGACIKDAYFDAENSLGRAIQNSNEIVHYNLQSVTKKIKTVGKNPEDIWNIVAWNLNGSDYDGYIEAEVQWAHEFDWYDKGIELRDEKNNVYPCQIIREKSVIPKFRSRFVFKDTIPSVGYKMYRVVKTQTENIHKIINPYKIDTQKLTVTFSEKNGIINSVCDKESGKELCKNIMIPKCYYDDGDTWAFNIDGYDDAENEFMFIDSKVIESGDLRTTIKNIYKFKNSILNMYYTFYENEKYFDISYKINWNEKHYVFKLDTMLESNHCDVSVPYGKIERGESVADVPMGSWLKTDNFSVFADSVFSYNLRNKTLGLTVLRSPIYGDLRLSEIDYEEDYDIISQGINEGSIRVDFDKGEAKKAEGFVNRPIVVVESNHDGVYPSVNSYFSIDGDGVSLSAIKKCEYDDSLILRLIEENGKSQNVLIKMGEKQFSIDITPFEIKTLKIKDNKVKEYYMTEDEEIYRG